MRIFALFPKFHPRGTPTNYPLFYRHDVVARIYDALTAHNIPCWMDIKGGMAGSINEAMAEGVENSTVIIPFLTEGYQNSRNCKKELNYADSKSIDIIPVMLQKNFKASGWLGIATAGLLWHDFRDLANFDNSIEKLASEIRKRFPQLIENSVPASTPKPQNLPTTFHTADTYVYEPIRNIKDLKKPEIKFQVKNRNDAHILLKAGQREFEIVVGGWGNTRSVIRERKQGPELTHAQKRVCDPSKFKDFCISWDNDMIKVFNNRDKLGEPLMETGNYSRFLINQVPISEVFFATGWGNSGEWRVEGGMGPAEPYEPLKKPVYDPKKTNFHTGNDYHYHLVRKISDLKSKSINFQVKNKNDAHVLLKAGKREFEIVIGGWGNKRSVIDNCSQKRESENQNCPLDVKKKAQITYILFWSRRTY